MIETKEERLNRFIRQSGLVSTENLRKSSVTLVGTGSVNSFVGLVFSKMGVGKMKGYDDDGIASHNIAAQFFRSDDVGQFKTDALEEILWEFSNINFKGYNKKYVNQYLTETVIVAPDNMRTRKVVWKQFLKQKQAKYYIDARMGAELGIVYTIKDKSKKTRKFYEATLHDGAKDPLPCTERTIIYNVLMISSLIARAYKAIIQKEDIPKEMIFNMTSINEFSFMVRDE
jgi:molybdopterin/thiamine biosynthesis adenylyltransferase